MELEEYVASNDQTQIIKRKRTKRRLHSSSSPAATVSCSSSSGAGGYRDYNYVSTSSSHVSTEEEEDMANCLIMLAQSGGGAAPLVHRKLTENGGFSVYDCKTCNRSFPSFQALGGHRASHKKPKPKEEDNQSNFKPNTVFSSPSPPYTPPTTTVPAAVLSKNTNRVNKIHECSICGAEFTSGQALGGHMRRHRAAAGSIAAVTAGVIQMKQKNTMLALDLNLPAPPEDDVVVHRDAKFQYLSTKPPPSALVFSVGPTLVDCHY
jgi:hypothetical protein